MKKFIIGFGIAVCALFATTAPASAYSDEMAQVATMLNSELKNDPDIASVEYDGSNLVFTMKPSEDYSVLSLFGGEERTAMLKATLLSGLAEDEEEAEMMKQILKTFNTGLKFNVPIDGKMETVVFTPDELQ